MEFKLKWNKRLSDINMFPIIRINNIISSRKNVFIGAQYLFHILSYGEFFKASFTENGSIYLTVISKECTNQCNKFIVAEYYPLCLAWAPVMLLSFARNNINMLSFNIQLALAQYVWHYDSVASCAIIYSGKGGFISTIIYI